VLAALLAALLLCLLGATTAGAGALEPRGKKIFFGISDTGDSADFGGFSTLLNKHPALIESFRTWGSDFPESIERWQDARARPILHITTADNNDGHELISPQAIAQGYGDEYLIRQIRNGMQLANVAGYTQDIVIVLPGLSRSVTTMSRRAAA